ncbi:hypothetical protein JCM5350_000988 [Sporobolomyces pararoseus]
MSRSAVEELDKLTLDDTRDLSPRSPSPLKPTNPFLSVPPELLSDILQHCKRPSYRAEKAEFARLSRVSKQFFPIAQQLLYRSITIVIRPNGPNFIFESNEEVNTFLRDYQLRRTLGSRTQTGSLVQVLDIAFDEIPPSLDAGDVLGDLLAQVPKLQQLWLIDQGRGFWPVDRKDVEGSLRGTRTLIGTLTHFQARTLKTLVMPQIEVHPFVTHLVFATFSSLETFKGSVAASTTSPNLPQKVLSQLRRAYITFFSNSQNVNFALSASTYSLRYLHLCFLKENSPVELGRFLNLETLVITIKLITEPMLLSPGTNPSNAWQEWINEAPNKLISTALKTVESARTIESLRHFSLLTNVHQFLPPHFEKFFLRFPPSIREFSLDSHACHSLPWSIFLLHHRQLYPHLEKFILRRPKDSKGDNAEDSKVYFEGINDFQTRSGIEIEWIEDDNDKWGYFTEKLFCPWASEEELIGRENEFAKKQVQAENLSCVIS